MANDFLSIVKNKLWPNKITIACNTSDTIENGYIH